MQLCLEGAEFESILLRGGPLDGIRKTLPVAKMRSEGDYFVEIIDGNNLHSYVLCIVDLSAEYRNTRKI